MPEPRPQQIYQLDECEIDVARRELRIRGAVAPVGARALEILEVLMQSHGVLLTREDLAKRVWPGATVPDNTIQVHVSAIRKALGPYREFLKTESGRGYRLIGDWTIRERAQGPDKSVRTPIAVAAPSAIPDQRRPTNFPGLPSALIGRDEALQQLHDLLSAYRAVTLTGSGGIGKTALAVEVARACLPGFADGGWLIELASLSDAQLVPTAVSTILDLRLSGDAISAEAVARTIGDRSLLLLLDNCEHVVDAVALLAETLLLLSPRVTILATSREVLRIAGEYVYRVAPLAVPADDQEAPDSLLRHSAVEFFITRMRAQNASLEPDVAALPTIASICRRLDGIPLALEFAAARAAVLGIPEVAIRLEDRFQLLTGGRRTALPRHQTLRAALDWSYDLLPEDEQRLLRHMALFPAGFTVDAAAAVSGIGVNSAAAAEGIANLVGKSLIALDRSEAVSRWYLLDTIRVYAAEMLIGAGEFEGAARHQAAYFVNLFGRVEAEAGLRLFDYDWSRALREIDNIRAALDWCFSPAGDTSLGVDLTAAYAPVWLHLSLMEECRERCERALRGLSPGSAPHARLQMWLQIDLAICLFDTMGSAQEARNLLNAALGAADKLGDLNAQAGALSSLVAHYLFQAELGQARATAERLMNVAREMGDPAVIRIADRLMGTALVLLGRPREAQRLLERFLQTHPAAPGQQRLVWYPADHRSSARAFLARSLWIQGFLERAYAEAEASLDELAATDHQLLLCRVLYFGMCRIAPSTGDFTTARQSIARLTEAATRLKAPFWQTAGRLLEGKLMVELGEFAEGAAILRHSLATCRQTGWRMSYVEYNGALAAALAALGQLDEALAAVDEGLTITKQGEGGHDLYLAEALRIKGQILLQRGANTAAEVCFRHAFDIARQQDALFWELRIALSFAGMRASESRQAEAKRVLAPIYSRFTEGFNSPDLRVARALLDKLGT